MSFLCWISHEGEFRTSKSFRIFNLNVKKKIGSEIKCCECSKVIEKKQFYSGNSGWVFCSVCANKRFDNLVKSLSELIEEIFVLKNKLDVSNLKETKVNNEVFL